MSLSPREHAHMARSLIDACGGVDEILRQDPPVCRRHRSQLFEYRNGKAMMPADVMSDLEAYAGEPIYSRVLVERRPARPADACPREAALDHSVRSGGLQALLREVLRDGVVTLRERDTAEALLVELEAAVAQIRAGLDRRMSPAGGAS